MNMQTVIGSSSVLAVGYDKDRSVMAVQYTTGTYEYKNITEDEYNKVFIGESVGKAVRALIKGKEYQKI